MLSTPLRLVAFLNEPGLALRVFRGLDAMCDEDVELEFVHGVDELEAAARTVPAPLVLVDAAPRDGIGSAEHAACTRADLRAALESAPSSQLILIGASEEDPRVGLTASERRRVSLLEELAPR